MVGVEVVMRQAGLTYPDEAIATVCNLAYMERAARVLEVIAFALCHLHVEDRACYLSRAVWSTLAKTREAAAYSLGGVDAGEAIAEPILLSADADGEVRNWATFSLTWIFA